ncbi:MAG: LOG family protein [Ignavibacteria bacterium]
MGSKTVTVFGSSIPKPGDREYEDAYFLGKYFGGNNLNVCTGGYQGTMDAVSRGANEKGAEAVGINLEIYNAVPSQYLTNRLIADSLFERLEKLISFADAYVILPGGTGTLLELSLVWEYFNKSMMEHKPIAIYGTMWKNLFTDMEERITFEKRKAGMIKYFEDIKDCAEYIVRELKN